MKDENRARILECATRDTAIFAPATLAHPDNMHQNENTPLDLVRRIMPDDRRSTLGGAIMRGPEALLFGAAGNLNIIRFTIINFMYNAETISRTLVTRVQALEP